MSESTHQALPDRENGTSMGALGAQNVNDVQDVMGQVDVSVVIVNYNVKDFLSQALRSVVQASEGLLVEVFVVDNNSIDNSVAMVRREYPSVILLANAENVGFGKANNQAIRVARGRHILILNPDTIVQEDSLRAMVAFLDARPDCGALGCQILNPDGSFAPESRRSFPSPQIAIFRMIGLSTLFPKSKLFGKYNLTYIPREEECEVDALSGSCMMVRRETLFGEQALPGQGHGQSQKQGQDEGHGEDHGKSQDQGHGQSQRQGHRSNGTALPILFDEDFFMYGEDLDLCYRIKEAGWKIWYTPSTQIIHYKGESTKKGELRYVKLFYGAMLLFIEKHLEFQHAPFMSGMLRAGIMVRASITLIANGIKASAPLFLDFFSMYAVVSLLGMTRFWQTDVDFTLLFFVSIAPVFATATVLGMVLAGGYRSAKKRRIEPVVMGVIIGFLTVATSAYFIQSIAFSRWVVGLAVPLGIMALMLRRVLLSRKKSGPRKALLVGDYAEAVRLSNLLANHPRPPFKLEGYVCDSPSEKKDVTWEGRLSHLRDLVRLKGYEDLVFAAKDLPNHVTFGIMRNLKDLPVQFRMMQEGEDLVIGKSTISHLSLGSLQGDVTELVHIPSDASTFLFERAFSLFLLPFWPFIWLFIRFLPRSSAKRSQLSILLQTPSVLLGRKALVGKLREHAPHVPPAWNVPDGLFSVTNTMTTQELEPEDITRAYWYYVTHQTPGLDLEIIVASLRSS